MLSIYAYPVSHITILVRMDVYGTSHIRIWEVPYTRAYARMHTTRHFPYEKNM